MSQRKREVGHHISDAVVLGAFSGTSGGQKWQLSVYRKCLSLLFRRRAEHTAGCGCERGLLSHEQSEALDFKRAQALQELM